MKRGYSSKLVFEVRDIWPMVLLKWDSVKSIRLLLTSRIEWLGYKFSDEIVGTMPRLDILEKLLMQKM